MDIARNFNFMSLMPTAVKTPQMTLSDFFNNLKNFNTLPPVTNPSPTVATRTQNLPNGAGSYTTPSGQKPPVISSILASSKNAAAKTSTPAAPFYPTPNGQPIPASAPAVAPVVPSTPATPATNSKVPAQWINPKTGTFYTPDEIAQNIVASAPTPQPDIPKFAGDQFTQGPQTTPELQSKAAELNNARNDVAVGETDPYKVASESGVAYTPAELAAIEKAYSGVYDPALNSALAKLDQSQKKDAANNAPFTLGKDDVRYDGQGNPIAVGISSDAGTTGTYAPGANPTVDAFIKGIQAGTYKASDVPDEYKALVAQGMAVAPSKQSKAATDAISVIDQLIGKGDALGNISGFPSPGALFGIPGTDAAASKNLAKQLAGILSLENRTQLKGSGAISDFEFKVLSDAASSLGIGSSGRSNLKDEDFVNELNKVKLKLQVGPTDLTDDELIFLKNKNYSPKEIKALSNIQSFSSVGNTSASTSPSTPAVASNTGKNIPQRNNNPGNVKGGGLADDLAVGKDSQGHLIFKNPIDGFKALTMDLTAKVNGGSKYLPPNPTIAQLGKVYAEDPRWAQNVAKILGVDPSTPTQSVPITSLAQAVARAEGFYA
jgi:hypothetical protein